MSVRLNSAKRRLEFSGSWRKLGRFVNARKEGEFLLIEFSRDIYFSPEMPSDDLRAQLIIALVQLRVLSEASEISAWLEKYLRRFRMPPCNDRRSVRNIVAARLLMNWSYPEDFRAFRKYIKRIIWAVIKQEAPRFETELRPSVEAKIRAHHEADQNRQFRLSL